MRALVLALLLVSSSVATAEVLRVGERLAEVKGAVDGAGKTFRFESLKGQWVLVTVGASWCKPCRKELPTWDKLAADYKGKVAFVSINIDDDRADGQHFNAQLKLKNLGLVYAPVASAARYGAETMPSTFVADPAGVVRFRKDGFEERNADGEAKKLRAQLDKLLK